MPTPFSEMYEGIHSVYIRSLCIFVDTLTVCFTYINSFSLISSISTV